MPTRASASFGHTQSRDVNHRRTLEWLALWLVIGSIIGSALIETRTVEFLAELFPQIYPIRVASLKCISLIIKCLYQRLLFASWSKVIGADICALSVEHKQSFRYRFRQDRCPRSALFQQGFGKPSVVCRQRLLRIPSIRESQLILESYRKSLYVAASA